MKKSCVFVDVFTDVPYAGNGLAVFPDARGLIDEQMQHLANEINYSETSFVLESTHPGSDRDVRIFTPANELPFAGHPVIGTAYALLEFFDVRGDETGILRLRTKVGVIPVTREGRDVWMTQNPPEFLARHADLAAVARLVNLTTADIMSDLPVEDVSTGNRTMIVPVKTLEAVARARPDGGLMIERLPRDLLGIYIFSLQTTQPGVAVHTRFFAPHVGILEDPATGSAAGPLTGYLLKHRVFGDRFEIENEQGVEMGRRSRILMRGAEVDGTYTVRIGGTCAHVGRAEFVI